jgi:hypothetical protein
MLKIKLPELAWRGFGGIGRLEYSGTFVVE